MNLLRFSSWLLPFAVLAMPILAQTNTFPSSGNAGIGTTSPTSGLIIQNEGSNYAEGSYFLINGANSTFGGGATLAGIKTTAADGGEYKLLRIQNAGGTKFIIDGSGNVGIGTTSPGGKLDVAGSFVLSANGGTPNGPSLSNYTAGNQLLIAGGTGGTFIQNQNQTASLVAILNGGNVGIGTPSPGAKLEVAGNMLAKFNSGSNDPVFKHVDASGSFVFSLNRSDGAGGNGNDFVVKSLNKIFLATNNSDAAKVVVDNSGNVGIGTTNPSHKLAVNGTIRAKEVIVDTGWSDYVFDESYRLKALSEIEAFVKTEKRLPGIPSAKEVAEHGVSVGEMQSKLLAKIEELTLHVIAQEKRIARVEAENFALRATRP